ncbi:hypothetical protein HZB03_03615 [Candidatus Woesearchaeota archaeon]|nr:hypothetical protein [Candidatus Woesearchaeota archaeon]
MFQLQYAGRKRALARIFVSFIIILAAVGMSVIVGVRAQTASSSSSSLSLFSSSSSSSQLSSSLPSSQSPEQVIEPNNAGAAGAVCPFTVLEGNVLRLRAEGFDPDGDIGPAGELLWEYAPPLSPFGLWQTRIGDAGRYTTGIKLSDGALTDTITFCIDVVPQPTAPQPTAVPSQFINRAPTLFGVDDLLLEEGKSAVFKPTCIDPDGDDVSITVSTELHFPVYESKAGDAGNYLVQVTCTDAHNATASAVQQVVVKSKNHPPTITVNDATAYEGELIVVRPSITDADDDPITFSIEGPTGMDGAWQTYAGDAGDYTITVFASDGKSLTQTQASIHILAKQQLQEEQSQKVEVQTEVQTAQAQAAEVQNIEVVMQNVVQKQSAEQAAVEVVYESSAAYSTNAAAPAYLDDGCGRESRPDLIEVVYAAASAPASASAQSESTTGIYVIEHQKPTVEKQVTDKHVEKKPKTQDVTTQDVMLEEDHIRYFHSSKRHKQFFQ